ncbi:MAG: ThiF family adenylyltransferase [Dehalococcoidales bacterium]|nr:ThiF family adenylyltransferase [Dehalococcoidales bacterium]
MNYDELVKSNWGFIDPQEQEKISSKCVLLAGCGLGSNIAVLATRTGFSKFILADGDSVSLSNLNRQAFKVEHIGRNKAEVTAELIHEINPHAEIQVFPRFITTQEDVVTLVSKADQIVNMVDPSPVLFQLNHIAGVQDKPVLFPLNLGFGAAVFVFTSTTFKLEERIPDTVKPEFYFYYLIQKMNVPLPCYLQKFSEQIITKLNENVAPPQLGIAANISSALLVTAMVKLAIGQVFQPESGILTLDSWETGKVK